MPTYTVNEIFCPSALFLTYIRRTNGEIWVFNDEFVSFNFTVSIQRFLPDGSYIDTTYLDLSSNIETYYGGFALIETSTSYWVFGYQTSSGSRCAAEISKTDPTEQTYYTIPNDPTGIGTPTISLVYPSQNEGYVWIYTRKLDVITDEETSYFSEWSLTTKTFTNVQRGNIETSSLYTSIPTNLSHSEETSGKNAVIHLSSGDIAYARYEANSETAFISFIDESNVITSISSPGNKMVSCFVDTGEEDVVWALNENYLIKINTATKTIINSYSVDGFNAYYKDPENDPESEFITKQYYNGPAYIGHDVLANKLFWLSNANGTDLLLVVFNLNNNEVESSTVFPDENGIGTLTKVYPVYAAGDANDWWFGGNYTNESSFYIFNTQVATPPINNWAINSTISYPLTPNFADRKGWFGMALSLTASGGRLVVEPEYGGKTDTDAVGFVYTNVNDTWTLTQNLTATNSNIHRGNSVVIAGNGTSVLLTYVDTSLGAEGTSYALFYNNTGS